MVIEAAQQKFLQEFPPAEIAEATQLMDFNQIWVWFVQVVTHEDNEGDFSKPILMDWLLKTYPAETIGTTITFLVK
jgi:hypothetical protein